MSTLSNKSLQGTRGAALLLRWPIQCLTIYICFFLSGVTSMVFEILWSRRFVTVFGNSSYAVSIVLCAFMAGLGLGGWTAASSPIASPAACGPSA